jgi:hypothetical protein
VVVSLIDQPKKFTMAGLKIRRKVIQDRGPDIPIWEVNVLREIKEKTGIF